MRDTAAARRHFLIPRRARRPWLPALPAAALGALIERLMPAERRAPARIVETADLVEAGGRQWLLVPAEPALIDDLAAFAADDAEREDGGDAEPDDAREDDGDREGDTADAEPDGHELRRRFAAARHRPAPPPPCFRMEDGSLVTWTRLDAPPADSRR